MAQFFTQGSFHQMIWKCPSTTWSSKKKSWEKSPFGYLQKKWDYSGKKQAIVYKQIFVWLSTAYYLTRI